MKTQLILIITSAAFLLTGCLPEEHNINFDDQLTGNADAELQSYFEAFEVEAAMRGEGVHNSFSDIAATLVDFGNPDLVAECCVGADDFSLTIDRNFWKNVAQMDRDFMLLSLLSNCHYLSDHPAGPVAADSCKVFTSTEIEAALSDIVQLDRDELVDELFNGK